MTRLVRFSNNAVSKLASAITAASTTISLQAGDGSKFPTLTGTQFFMATLVKSDGTTEVVKVTARTGDTLTVVRAAEAVGGVQTAYAFSSGDRIEHRLTAKAIGDELDRLDQAALIAAQNKTANYTVTAADITSLIRMNTAGGNLTVTLPDITTLTDDFDVIVAKVSADNNVVTIARSGADTINGATSYALTNQWQGAWLTADRSTGTWTVIASGGGGVRANVDTFTGTGTAGPFTLSGDPGIKENTAVYVGGVYQQKSTYTLVGTSLTVGGNVPAGVSVEVVWAAPLQVGITSANQTTASDGASGSLFTTVQGFITRLLSSAGASMVGFIQAGTGAVARLVQDKLRDVVSVKDFGVVGDGVTDDTAAWRAWINYCALANVGFVCQDRITSRITGKLVFPRVVVSFIGGARALPINLSGVDFLYDGPRNDIAIDIGEAPGASGYYPETEIWLPRLNAAGTLQWPGTLAATDIGIRIRQAFRCRIYENFTYGFTNGIVYSGCAYNTIFAKHISDAKFSLVYTTEGSNIDYSFTNENTRIGGKLGNTSAASALGNAFMVVFTWDKVSSYRGHNANRFIAPCLESNGAATYQMPIWFDGVGGGTNSFEHVRLEGCRGPVALFDGGGGARACNTTIHLDYIAYAGQEISLRQVNGACGNVLTGAGCYVDQWSSGDLQKQVTSAGAAGTAWLRGKELFFINAGTPAITDFKRIETVFTSAVRVNRQGVHLDTGGYARIAVAIDTTRIKDFECAFDSLDGFIGRPSFMALDSRGQLLTGTATETFANPLTGSTYSNEQYVKASTYLGDSGQVLSVSGPLFTTSADAPEARTLRVTVRPEVATLIFSVVGASTIAVVKSMSVRAFATANTVGEAHPTTRGKAALRVFSLVDEDGSDRMATAKPDTAGTLGYYPRGAVVFNRNAASGQPIGWQCNAAGWLCPAWAASTAYSVPGTLATNDLGKVYELTTAGTSASSGGPTGTTATWDGITDGTAKWRYIGTLATFAAMPNNP